ncbi:MAG: hypothetical protein ISR84_06525 [Kiritimatiellales bacterium]|nr:hypothetical protein [Kiritimatiellales bacterium]
MTAPADKIWATLHNELTPKDREQFEQARQEDPALNDALEECRATHQVLAELGREALSDEQLADKLMAEWAAEHPEYAESPARRRTLRFALPLAAAAALVLLLTLPAGPIRWQRTLYGNTPQLRGEPAAQAGYARADLKQAARELQDAVEAFGDPAEKWTLQITLQELADGALDVEVSGSRRENSNAWKNSGAKAPPSSNAWKKSFQSLENFRQNIPRFGKQIADAL